MKITSRVDNSNGRHEITLSTNTNSHSITIPPRLSGYGSSANGGELLFLALATCYCNDIYREAAKRGIQVERVEAEVEGEFGAEGEPAENVTYRARVTAHAPQDAIRDLVRHTDIAAEIQNALRRATPVSLSSAEAVSI